ncbi:pyranose 2-oxidase [Mycena albidolilacea]|uniref:Pyranose 2-oxidase n=1 Tax=Mycena albidolilacea TaxID=1033008 RepID=A0AAD7EEN1_9AGAR|nr:pyranose 2-oxidase [Mycena albidolilacea]
MSANTTIPKSQITFSGEKPTFDVCIIGSGPIGATYAKLLVKAGLTVAMVDIGAAKGKNDEDIFVPGGHKRNEIEYQKEPNARFTYAVQAALSTLSIPVDNARMFITYHAVGMLTRNARSTDKPFVSNGMNPNQDAYLNLDSAAVTRAVGGMSTHWGCTTPRLVKGLERPLLDNDSSKDDKLWDSLYTEAEGIIGTSTTQFKNSIRGLLIQATLSAAFPSRTFGDLPVACHRLKNDRYLEWHAAATILKDIYEDADRRKNFKLLPNHQCIKLQADEKGYKIEKALVKDLLASRTDPHCRDRFIAAKVFVVAAGAVGTPQILFNSGFSGDSVNTQSTSQIPNLGLFLTEQPVTFCQTIWKKSLLDSVKEAKSQNPDWWTQASKYHAEKNSHDPIPIPFSDPPPQVYNRPTKERPWHGQIQRDDAWSFGVFGDTVDHRLIVDFRFFGMATPLRENRVIFTHEVRDAYGMPQPTFEFNLKDTDRENSNEMLADMCAVASRIGGFLPGAEPQFQKPGTALHIAGTTRAGLTSGDSVVDTNCKVWDFDNLYLGGNGVISTAFAGNPTLTSMAYAIKSAKSIIIKLQTNSDQ